MKIAGVKKVEYIDGFVTAVPNENKEKYIQFARETAKVFKEYGAIRLVENWGVDVPEGGKTSLPMAVKCEENETVVFSWVSWPSKSARDEGWAKVMEDDRMQSSDMPFDGSRMIFGGFQMVVNE